MRLLCRYAGGLACLVTALALVACGGGPGSQPEPKPIENIAFSQGDKVRTISLSDKFNGTDLTYSATTSARSVATVTVDNDKDTLTVTVVGPGTATITVTAKNSQGEAKQTFTVTVPKPPPAPEPVEFTDIPSLDKDASETVPLGNKFSGENLTYSASSSHDHVVRVTVDNTANTLTLTAVGPGQAIITVTATATAQGSTPQTKTFTVTVPQPASEATAPTVKTGATSTVSVAVGATSTVALSTVFDGATSYTATSSPSTIATASESGGTLTITGGSIGSATVTVTATNAAGSSPAHAIAVTVTAAGTGTGTIDPPAPQGACTQSTRALTITINTSKKCTLSANHSLIYDPPVGTTDPGVSAVGPTGNNVWTITANKKGLYEVKINNTKTGGTVGTITVTVPNTPPKLGSPVIYIGDGTTAADLLGTDADTAADNSDDPIITGSFNPGASFKDVDEDDDPPPPGPDETTQGSFRFRVLDKPDGVLIDTHEGYVAVSTTNIEGSTFDSKLTSGVIYTRAVILKNPNPGGNYDILLYAYDSANDQSDNPVTVKVQAQNPYTRTYRVKQDDDGDFKKLKVGNRIGVTHTIDFSPAVDASMPDLADFAFRNGDDREPSEGLVRSQDVIADLVHRIPRTGAEDTTTTHDLTSAEKCSPITGPPSTWKDTGALGTGCFSARASNNDVEIINVIVANDEITFQLDPDHRTLNETSDVTITIAYHVIALSSKNTTAATIDNNTLGTRTVHSPSKWQESLTLDIHKCVDVEDCP